MRASVASSVDPGTTLFPWSASWSVDLTIIPRTWLTGGSYSNAPKVLFLRDEIAYPRTKFSSNRGMLHLCGTEWLFFFQADKIKAWTEAIARDNRPTWVVRLGIVFTNE